MRIDEHQESPLQTAKYLNMNSAIIWQNNYSFRDTSFFAWIGDNHPPVSEHTVAIFKIKSKLCHKKKSIRK